MLVCPMQTTGGAMTRQERKEAGRCTIPGCKRRCSGDTLLCHGHRRAAKTARQRYNQRKRKNKKLCRDCPRKVSDGRYCLRCRALRAGRRPRKTRAGENAGDIGTSIADRTRIDSDGRTRYHGQARRGQQPRAQLDEQDLDYAIASIARTKAGLAIARSPVYAALPRIQREEAVQAALSPADQGVRFVEEVLTRNRYGGRNRATQRDSEG